MKLEFDHAEKRCLWMPPDENSVLSRFRFSGGRLKFLEGPLTKKFFTIQLFMKSTVYFRLGESKFRVGAAHPVHPLDKSLDEKQRS
jgi:hypothetical protein